MVVDTSALVAILFGEPEAERFGRCLAEAPRCSMSAANWLETAMVVTAARGEAGKAHLDSLLAIANLAIVPVDAVLAETALAAWRRFGKGRHPAGLNFGDCFSYALAKSLAEPLLYKGADFAQTDAEGAA